MWVQIPPPPLSVISPPCDVSVQWRPPVDVLFHGFPTGKFTLAVKSLDQKKHGIDPDSKGTFVRSNGGRLPFPRPNAHNWHIFFGDT